MLVVVHSQSKEALRALPPVASGIHDVCDADGLLLAKAEGKAGVWELAPEPGFLLSGLGDDARGKAGFPMTDGTALELRDSAGKTYSLFFCEDAAGIKQMRTYGFAGDAELTIGQAANVSLLYSDSHVADCHARLICQEGSWELFDPGELPVSTATASGASALSGGNVLRSGVFVNGIRVPIKQKVKLDWGDVVSVLALRCVVGERCFSLNGPSGTVAVNLPGCVQYRAPQSVVTKGNAKATERTYFYPALRFPRSIQKKSFVVDAPPQAEKPDETSLAQRIGPSFVMALASLCSAAMSIAMLTEQGSTPLRAIPMALMAVSMLVGCVLWPVLNSRNQEKRRQNNEAKRIKTYAQYLTHVRTDMLREMDLQRQVLMENRVDLQQCLAVAKSCDKKKLMNRIPSHEDYLQVRIGRGDEPFFADIRFPDRHFTVEEDDAREAVEAFSQEPRILRDVPLAHSFIEKHVLGIVGPERLTVPFARGLVAQVAALCSYENVKMAVLCDERSLDEWEFAAHLPHLFTDDKSFRMFGCGLQEANEIGMFVERVMEARRSEKKFSAKDASPYYIVVCASEDIAERSSAIRSIVEEPENLGVSLVALAGEMRLLPKECKSVIGIEGEHAYLLERDDPTGTRKAFTPDVFLSAVDAKRFAGDLGRVRLDLEVESQKLPARLGFMEMLHAGNVGQFDFALRWRESNASASLACVVGADAQGELFVLNLHEKAHGPHGLIAGTTGSGKSEFIITWILSMAMTYSPDDAAFVLIDYKGGGLARAFDNEHVRLPHLAGVITNLDGRAIARSLVSIRSELKRRQALFNAARDVAGGENVDIYTYLDLYRQGRMSEPCPHLFIVADEFAELKQQEPEFMDELISAARIGRSLGVHLVLATQKPSGVVNDQIWSNSRFKICLKVADEADSREMIRRSDAAELVQAGRFYLLVGYNEYFALGQSGYSGTKYRPLERFEPPRDDSVSLISDTGSSLVTVAAKQESAQAESCSEQVAVLEAIQASAERLGMSARQLWLEPIPEMITVDRIAAKHKELLAARTQNVFELDPLIGELDDPERQRQLPLTLPLSREGSALIYGTTDSGIDSLLLSMVYSLVREHDAQHLNIYALDFGNESLRAFADAPQMGDVVCAGDDEKVRRFFAFIEAQVAKRRGVLARFGGSFERYTQQNSGMPSVLVIVNDVAALMEMYPQTEERIVSLTREAGRYGIHLVMTAAGTSSVRIRMRTNFRQQLAVDLPDPTEYGMVFGSMRGVPQPKGFERGLVPTEDGLLEFQGAHIDVNGNDFDRARSLSASLEQESLSQGIQPAPSIPTAPQSLLVEDLANVVMPDYAVPYGVLDSTLGLACLDFSESPLSRFVFQRKKSGVAFFRAFVELCIAQGKREIVLLDTAQLLGAKKPEGCAFATRKDDLATAKLASLAMELAADGPPSDEAAGDSLASTSADGSMGGNASAHPKHTLLIITGIASFLNRIDFEKATIVRQFLQGLNVGEGLDVVLFDSSTDAGYTYEDWFKAQLTNKDGVWVGPGIDGQNAIMTSYNSRFAPDASMRVGKGYAVDGGATSLVHLVSLANDYSDKEATQ